MDREKILNALKSQVETNIINHSIALESCLAGIFDYLVEQNYDMSNEPTKEEWKIAGLLHDIDFGGEFKNEHPNKTQEALDKYGLVVSDNVMKMIKAHAPELTGVKPNNYAQWSIFCADSLTGLIIAVAYVLPSRKLVDVKLSSVVKRFLKEPKFAAGTRREEVAMCANQETLNIPIEKFIQICLEAMQKTAEDIGL